MFYLKEERPTFPREKKTKRDLLGPSPVRLERVTNQRTERQKSKRREFTSVKTGGRVA